MSYTISMFGRRKEIVCRNTWDLRRQCRQMLGRRFSARCRYQQIGTNSFDVLYNGFVILRGYKT